MEAVLQSLHDSPVGEPGWSANKMKNTVPVRLHHRWGGGHCTGAEGPSGEYRAGNVTSDIEDTERGSFRSSLTSLSIESLPF